MAEREKLMFRWIKKLWKCIFPMPAKASEEQIRRIIDTLKETLENQKKMTVQLSSFHASADTVWLQQEKLLHRNAEMLESLLETVRAGQCSVERQTAEISCALHEICIRQSDESQRLEDLLRLLQEVRKQNDSAFEKIYAFLRKDTEKQSRDMGTALQKVLTGQKKQGAGISTVGQQIQEIIHGDIFRRIEFLQGRMINVEKLVQGNLLQPEEQRFSPLYQFILRMRSLFPMMGVEGSGAFSRIGRANDGGYVMLDDFEGRRIAYSFGIADDDSWDLGIAERGLDVYMYDHTVEGIPSNHPKLHFFRIGLAADGVQTGNLKSLTALMRENGHSEEYGMILKIDIEGAEWDVLCNLDENALKHFSQIVFEFHGLIFPENEEKIRIAMNQLNRTHQLVHIHANNYGTYLQLGGVILPELIEGTYLLREEYHFVEQINNVGWSLDSANNPYLPEIFLGAWQG